MTEKKIMESSATSKMVNLEGNMTNIRDAETRFTIADSRTLNGSKRVDWCRYHKCDKKIYHLNLTDMD